MKNIELIDKAIDALKGEVCNAADGYNHQYNFLWLDEVRGYRFTAGGQHYVGEYICKRTEFESRKAERQGKPSWGEHDYKFIHQGKNGHWYGSLKDNPASLPDMITDECWHYIETASARRGEVFGDYRNTLEQRPNHIGESDEKAAKAAKFISNVAVVSPYLAVRYARRLLPDLFDNSVASDNSADWYDYDKQEATKLPPVGAEFELWPHFHICEVVAHHDDGAVVYDRKVQGYKHIKWGDFRCWPLDFKPSQEVPSQSPELSFHLSNAFNELQASARLLPEDDPRRAQIVALAGGVGAVKEVA